MITMNQATEKTCYDLMDQCSPARHPTSTTGLLTTCRAHDLVIDLNKAGENGVLTGSQLGQQHAPRSSCCSPIRLNACTLLRQVQHELRERQGSGPSAAARQLASHTMAPRPSGLRPDLSLSRLGQAGRLEQLRLGSSGRCPRQMQVDSPYPAEPTYRDQSRPRRAVPQPSFGKMAAAVTTISRRETQNRRERLSGSRGGTNRAQQLTHFLDAMKRYGA